MFICVAGCVFLFLIVCVFVCVWLGVACVFLFGCGWLVVCLVACLCAGVCLQVSTCFFLTSLPTSPKNGVAFW